MEIVGCRAEENTCPFRPPAMLFHGISGGHIQGIMEEMERRSKTESRLAKGGQMNGRETVRRELAPLERGPASVGPHGTAPTWGQPKALPPLPLPRNPELVETVPGQPPVRPGAVPGRAGPGSLAFVPPMLPGVLSGARGDYLGSLLGALRAALRWPCPVRAGLRCVLRFPRCSHLPNEILHPPAARFSSPFLAPSGGLAERGLSPSAKPALGRQRGGPAALCAPPRPLVGLLRPRKDRAQSNGPEPAPPPRALGSPPLSPKKKPPLCCGRICNVNPPRLSHRCKKGTRSTTSGRKMTAELPLLHTCGCTGGCWGPVFPAPFPARAAPGSAAELLLRRPLRVPLCADPAAPGAPGPGNPHELLAQKMLVFGETRPGAERSLLFAASTCLLSPAPLVSGPFACRDGLGAAWSTGENCRERAPVPQSCSAAERCCPARKRRSPEAPRSTGKSDGEAPDVTCQTRRRTGSASLAEA